VLEEEEELKEKILQGEKDKREVVRGEKIIFCFYKK
jgi:hypothetical protein